jgi:hypothetical protein
MVFWQFITFTVLIGALVVYASVIARRLGRANARLSRIEEALLVTSRPGGFADPRAAESESEVSNNEGRAGYLTIRDLKARSEQLRSRATHSSTRNSVAAPETRDALKRTRGPKLSRGATPERGDSVAMSSESRAPVETSGELSSSLGIDPANGISVAKTSESSDALDTTGGQQSPPSHCPPSEDPTAKKNRNALLYMSNQRRRRRAHPGY